MYIYIYIFAKEFSEYNYITKLYYMQRSIFEPLQNVIYTVPFLSQL